MHTLRFPCDLDAKSRGTLVSYLGSGFNVAERYVPTLGKLATGSISASVLMKLY